MTNYILWVKTKDNPFWHVVAQSFSYLELVRTLCGMRGTYTNSAVRLEGDHPNKLRGIK